MSVNVSKRASGGFTVILYGTITDYPAELTYKDYGSGIRLVNNAGGWQSPDPNVQNITPTDWTVGGQTGFSTYEDVVNALDQLGVKLYSSGSGGSGGTVDISTLAKEVKQDDIIAKLTTVDESQSVTTGTNNNVPAGFKTVLISSLSGINTLDFGGGNTFEIGSGRRPVVISLDGSDLNTKNGLLPSITISGGTWQWIVLSKLTV